MGAITNADYRTINCVDTLIASAHLRRLRDLGLLEQKGRGNATYYTPTQNLLFPDRAPHTSSLSEGLTPYEHLQKLGKRTPTDAVKQVIKTLCSSRSFKPSEIALLLKRNQSYIRNHYLAPMIESGELELEFPNNPAHPHQAYRTSVEKP